MDYENITERRILVFGDSNTYGYDPERDGRYGETERYPCRIQALLGPGWTVIEEGLPGRTAVFDDPVTEGLCGLSYLTPCMMSHAPLDTLVVMLGTNDTKERFGCNAYLIAQGIGRLLKKAADTDAWRDKPDILAVCPAPIVPAYESLVFRNALGGGCAEKAAALAQELEPVVLQLGARFLDAGRVPGVEVHPLDGIHLTRSAHAALAQALVEVLKMRADKIRPYFLRPAADVLFLQRFCFADTSSCCMMDLKNDRNEKETEYSCETGQTYCTENPGHRGCGDILLLGPAKPVAAGGRGGLAA